MTSPPPSISFGLGEVVHLWGKRGGQRLTTPRAMFLTRASIALLPKSSGAFLRVLESLSVAVRRCTREGARPPAGSSGSRGLCRLPARLGDPAGP